MQVAVLGTGNVGMAFADTLSRNGISYIVGSRSVGAHDGDGPKRVSYATAVEKSDIVVLAMPFDGVKEAKQLHELADKVVIDLTNPLTEDFSALTVGHTTSAAEEIQKLIPKSKVVKAFNTVFAQVYGSNAFEKANPPQVFVAGDDEVSVEQVAELTRQIGFEPIKVGELAVARYLEPLAGLNIRLGYFQGWGTEISPAWNR
ncbi:NADPH-dependent F420 reductase [Phaeobacter sp. 11ANDIMAR09]|uniref:NADPH-dependent F420 reductase n=1 Tax=Phaeobacter sp. 11ANDIMAR09 TaxID=1225647 RepID=UPI0006C89E92|nr:NAD(P)-binding domain-containing protein [Phaeobacter sp. 11ANDIMAR09]KPD11067.1 hypothetical protein AN476_17780 [Phaeobacter sp. 11ANDIMAR09]